jgi:hypothetical protein
MKQRCGIAGQLRSSGQWLSLTSRKNDRSCSQKERHREIQLLLQQLLSPTASWICDVLDILAAWLVEQPWNRF